jgi:hypothetical protein
MVEKGVAEGAAKRAMAKVLQMGGEEAAEKYIAKSGLKFMGKVFMPKEYFDVASNVINKMPGAASLNKVGNGVAKAFIPFKEIDNLPASIGGKGMYTDFLYKPYSRETTHEIIKQVNEIKKVAHETMKKNGADIGQEIGYRIETKTLTGDTALDNVIQWMGKEHEEMLAIERATGKKVGEISGYIRHYLTPDGQKFLSKSQSPFSVLPKGIKAKLTSAKPREIKQTIKEINEHMLKTHGVKNFFEPDAFKAFAMRKAEHIKYINTILIY